ncbi:MAG: hypothetical protein MZW92_38000 [Comamonadaceae bacterium]|nr:hypothetical protein [Comamonadaceae bacterium]
MLYFKALREGLSDLPQADPATAPRDRRAGRAPAAGRRCTPSWRGSTRRPRRGSAPDDAQRIQRALEVVRAHRRAAGRQLCRESGDARPFRLHRRWRCCRSDRAALHERIAARFDAMLAAGLVDEVRGAARPLRACSLDLPSMRARRLPPGVGLSGRRDRPRGACA